MLPPAYFALVMATGILSIDGHYHGLPALAWSLFALNIVQYAVLWGALVLRLIRYRKNVVADAGDHLRGPGFFTLVAATGVLAVQCFVVAGWRQAGLALSALTVVLWLFLIYAVFALMIVKPVKPALEKGINGGWLVGIVATQSVSIASVYAGRALDYQALLLFGGLLAWSFGVMLYIWIISLIFYRYLFFAFEPNDLSPPYWINMGAMAISTLAGCGLIAAREHHPLLTELIPFIKGITLLLWSTATWWIPMLLILGFWRHVVKRFPMKYDPLYWGMVFPFGMYSACTFRLGQELGLPSVFPVARVFLYLGLGVWAVVFTGMLRDLFFSRKALPAPAGAVAGSAGNR